MIRRLLYSMLLVVPILGHAQTEDTTQGIKWTTGLTWAQVKAKAKAENKFIFVDAFATWCGPCKLMDKDIYTDQRVGAFFNDKIICIKVQMDQTEKDPEDIKEWYKDAEAIQHGYKITAYPSYIFLSPTGTITSLETGYRGVVEFIEIAEEAIKPGKIYADPFAEYDNLIKDYNNGIKDYRKMLSMIESAKKIGDQQMTLKLANDYHHYLAQLQDENLLYTKKNIEFLSSIALTTKLKTFKMFYPDGRKVDRVMGYKGYAEFIVDKVIQREIVDSFLKVHPNSGMRLMGEGLPVDKKEASWKKLEESIRLKFNPSLTERSLLTAKVNWYDTHNNYPAFVEHLLLRVEKYGIDPTEGEMGDAIFNFHAYDIFEKVTDKKQLRITAKWMKKVVERQPAGAYMDTYASLLYKLGEVNKAIAWEEKALVYATEKQEKSEMKFFAQCITKMKNGELIWIK